MNVFTHDLVFMVSVTVVYLDVVSDHVSRVCITWWVAQIHDCSRIVEIHKKKNSNRSLSLFQRMMPADMFRPHYPSSPVFGVGSMSVMVML